MEIRAANPNDLSTLITWIPDEQACRTWAGPQVSFPLEKDRLSVEIGFSSDNSFCLVDSESMVAFGQLLSLRPAYLHMARIIVDPTRRNQSHGRKLCQGLVRITREIGFHNISLNVYRENLTALALYESIGFKEVPDKSSEEFCHMVKTSRKCMTAD